MAISWQDASEIVCGMLWNGKLALNAVRPEIFFPPYDEIIKRMKENKNKEEIILSVGMNPIQSSIDAAENLNGLASADWLGILEKTAIEYDAGMRLEKFGKRLQRGDEIDWANVHFIAEKAQNKTGGMFVPLSEIEGMEMPLKKTGFTAIDEHLGGIPEIGQIIVAAAPGSGKTTFMTELAACWSKLYKKENVAIFTLEMMAKEIKMRFTEVMHLSEDQQSRILINDDVLTPEEVINYAATIENLGLVCIDFADLLISGETTESSMGHIYRTFMLGAKKLGCPVVLLSQLNRNYNGGIPRPNNIRYCLPENARVFDAITGEYFSLKDKSSGYILSFDGEKLVPAYFTSTPTGNKQNILKITTKSGFVLRCSDNHPLLRGNEWVRADKLNVGDQVGVVREISPQSPIIYSSKRARLLGYMLGDGYMPARSSGAINWVEADEVVINDFKACLAEEFVDITTRDVWHRNSWQVNVIQDSDNNRPTEFALWLESYRLRGVKSKERFIPQECFMWNNDAISALLQGLFISDGSIANGIVSFASYAPQLLLDVKHLLLRFGILSRISGTKLTITTRRYVEKFSSSIGFIGKKKDKLNEFLSKSENYDIAKDHSETMPMEVTKILIEHGFMSLIRNRAITKYRLDKILSAVEDLKYYSNQHIWWDGIKSIEQDGMEYTYDLTTSDYHNFVVDGFVTHNTGLAEALGSMILMLYNPNIDWFSDDEQELLPIVENYAYIIAWKIRGGFRIHKNDCPGAIQLQFKGEKGWRTNHPGKWFTLQKA